MSLNVSETKPEEPKRRPGRPAKYPGIVSVNVTKQMSESIERLLKGSHVNQSVLLREFLHRGLVAADPDYKRQVGG
jgi:hypothetical protein